MEKLNGNLFSKEQISTSQLSNILGGYMPAETWTTCESATCNDYTGQSDLRKVSTDDNGKITSITTTTVN